MSVVSEYSDFSDNSEVSDLGERRGKRWTNEN